MSLRNKMNLDLDDPSDRNKVNRTTSSRNHQTGQPGKWRVFLAVPIPGTLKHNLAEWGERLRPGLPFKKWVYSEDFHITVQFLGDIDESQMAGIHEALRSAVKGLSPFQISLAGTGVFGLPAAPRVLWAAVAEGMDRLQRLNKHVTSAMAPLGFIPEERPYSPHVTIARQFLPGGSFHLSPQEEQHGFGSWEADAVVLYRTHMGRQPMYEEVLRVGLSGNRHGTI